MAPSNYLNYIKISKRHLIITVKIFPISIQLVHDNEIRGKLIIEVF